MADLEYADLIGVPFKKAARGPDSFDCYGLVREMCRRAGKDVPNYPTHSSLETENAQILSGMEEWKPTTEKPGAVAVFRVMGKLHVGYILPYGKMIHAWERSGGVIVERFEPWKRRVIGYYEY
jgi:cell wall-associated NlpC family hydrolase